MLEHYYKDDILNIINYRCLHFSIYIPTLKHFIDFILIDPSIRVYIILQQPVNCAYCQCNYRLCRIICVTSIFSPKLKI